MINPREPYGMCASQDGDWAEIEFEGRFQGRAVIWRATVMTLAQYAFQYGLSGPLRGFIDVADAEDEAGVRSLHVVLPVKDIDPPTLRKAVIMVRQYRRLRVGRHEFGPPESEKDEAD